MEGPYDPPERSSNNNNVNTENTSDKYSTIANANIVANNHNEEYFWLSPFTFSYDPLFVQDNINNNKAIIVNENNVANNNSFPIDDNQILHNNNDSDNNAITKVAENDIEGDQFVSYPFGYRFVPNDEELINYLKDKINDFNLPHVPIHEVDIYKFHPQELTEKYEGEGEWFFFTPRVQKYSRGNRPARTASYGYWKPTGADMKIPNKNNPIGTRMSLDYWEFMNKQTQKRKDSLETRTNWKMHEYMVKQINNDKGKDNKEFLKLALCKIYKKKTKKDTNEKDEAAASTSNSVNTTKVSVDDSQQMNINSSYHLPENCFNDQYLARIQLQDHSTSTNEFQSAINGLKDYDDHKDMTANNSREVVERTPGTELVNNEALTVQHVVDNSDPDGTHQNNYSCCDYERQDDDGGLYSIVRAFLSTSDFKIKT